MKNPMRYKPVQHGVKGSFTCLGVWFNLSDWSSNQYCVWMLATCTSTADRITGMHEYSHAMDRFYAGLYAHEGNHP